MNKKVNFLILCLLVLLRGPSALAGWSLEAQGTYMSDVQKAAVSTQGSRLYWQGAVLGDVNKKLSLGWSYSSLSVTSEFVSDKNRFEAQDTGFMLRYKFDRKGIFSSYLVYNISAKAQQSDGSSQEDLSGYSYMVGFTVTPALSEKLFVGLQMNYLDARYNKKVINGVEESASYSHNWFFPSLLLIRRF